MAMRCPESLKNRVSRVRFPRIGHVGFRGDPRPPTLPGATLPLFFLHFEGRVSSHSPRSPILPMAHRVSRAAAPERAPYVGRPPTPARNVAREPQRHALREVGALVTRLIRAGLMDVEPGGSVRVEITAVRSGPRDSDVRLDVRVDQCAGMSVESECLAKELAQLCDSDATRTLSLEDRAFLTDVIRAVLCRSDDPDFDVDGLARCLYLSPSQLRRRLRSAFGKSPAQMIRLTRLLRARQLVDQGEASLSAIAHACGFSDHAHLSRTFRRHFHATPSESRRSSRQARTPAGVAVSPPASAASRPR